MKNNYKRNQSSKIRFERSIKNFITLLMVFGISMLGYSQKKGGGKGAKDIIVRACVQDIGNGLFRVNFGYDNPNKKEISIAEDNSYVVSSKGKNKTKGVNAFKKGSVEKAFTREFAANESVEWTVINPNGKVHTVVASANSSHCPEIETGFIFPVFGQGNGKSFGLADPGVLALANGTAGDSPSDIIYQIDENNEKVLLEIVPKDGNMQQVIDLLQNKYFIPISDFLIDPSQIISKNLTTIDVNFPIPELNNLTLEIDDVNFIRLLYPSFKDNGIVTTQGDSIQRSDLVRDSYRIFRDGEIVPVDGTGIKTGVISDSYDTQPFTGLSKATIDVQNGDLPGLGNPNLYEAPVEVLKEYTYGIASDEGRAMLHIVHDVAPGSELGFYSGILSPRDFELGIELFMAEDYHIIIDDITFITEPFFGTGRIPQAIQAFTSLPGRTYFSSAGNFSNSGYQAIFNSSSTVPSTNFLTSSSQVRSHIFGTNTDGSEDDMQKIHVVPGVYMIVLQWDENIATQESSVGAITDLDIYIVDDFGNLIVGNNRVNELGDPTEIIVFQSTGTGEANIMITSANGAPLSDLPIRYIAFRADGLDFLEYGGAATTSGHAMTFEANIVAAVDIRTADNPEVQFFSSHGGNISNGFYSEIDFSAPNGVFTNVPSVGQILNAGDIFTSFFGTSASAPHAAASVALLMSVQQSWYPDGFSVDFTPKTNPTADQAIQLFKENAISTGNPDIGGAGFIDVEKVFKSIANQTPKLLKLLIEDGKTPGIDSLEVTIIGEYFLSEDETTVIFDGEELEIVSITETEIVVQVSAFTANPCIVVSSDSTTPGGTDGGDSNCLQFLEDGKLAINIIADDISIKYGQTVSFSFHVEGLPESISYESTGLPEVKFNTPAVFPFPDVNNYVLAPNFDVELTEEQLASYQVNFINGIFSVTKNDLTITPEDAIYTYGDAVEVILNYVYNEDGIDDSAAFLNLIQTSHQSDFYEENTLILINKLKAVVNEQEILNLLDQRSWMTSRRTIQNKLKAVVNGMNLIELEPQHFQDFMDAVTDPETNKLKAVVNKLKAVVNGQDLIDNLIDLVIENKLKAVVNGTGLGDENDKNDYSFIFAIIDAEDGSTETEERRIDTLYSMNLITGIEVTAPEEGHLLFPGALLSAVGANLNITYGSGNVNFLAKTITVRTNDLQINYGDLITSEDFTTVFEGFVFDETAEIIYPDGIPYYFIKIGGDGTEIEINELVELGDYQMRIRNPQNYILNHTLDAIYGILTISPTTLTAETVHFEASYGENFEAADLTTVFNGFAYDETVETVYSDGVPYFFVDTELNEYELGDRMPVGDYQIKIRGTETYLIEYGVNHSTVTIIPALLTVKTTELEIEYGDDVQELIATDITGFASGESLAAVFADGIQYLFVNGSGVEFVIDTVKELGIYEVIVSVPTTLDNYEITYADDHGTLAISPRLVNVKTVNLNKNYGYNPIAADLTTEFIDFAPGESVEDVFGSANVPYYFEDALGAVFNLGDEIEVGDYQIKIEETNIHYIFEFDSSINVLSIIPKSLMVTIDDLVIDQGDTPLFISNFAGFVFGDSESSVYPSGIPYYIIDDLGIERSFNDTGVFTIKIRDPKNYIIDTNNAKLYINPSNNTDKIRTYADCVAYDPSASDGLFYTVIYRYENGNDAAVFVLDGADNNLSGPAIYEGQLPTVFLPGSGTFEIRFDGKRLVWNLTTFGSTHKSSVSSSSTSESGKCDAKLGGDYEVYPNPVTSTVNYKLTIRQNIAEVSDVTVLNLYGATVFSTGFDGSKGIIEIDMSSYPSGMYYVRITNGSEVKVFSIIKE